MIKNDSNLIHTLSILHKIELELLIGGFVVL